MLESQTGRSRHRDLTRREGPHKGSSDVKRSVSDVHDLVGVLTLDTFGVVTT